MSLKTQQNSLKNYLRHRTLQIDRNAPGIPIDMQEWCDRSWCDTKNMQRKMIYATYSVKHAMTI